MKRLRKFPLASKDKFGRLLVNAAVGVGDKEGLERVELLEKSGVDVIVVDTAHGHSKNVIDILKKIKKKILTSSSCCRKYRNS